VSKISTDVVEKLDNPIVARLALHRRVAVLENDLG
jgi:hypothetical protein